MPKPQINVTPLINVLLVLLVIFMIITPLKPSTFKARIPAEPEKLPTEVKENPQTLAIIIGSDSSLSLNRESGIGTIDSAEPLIARLKDIFDQRVSNGDISSQFASDPERPFADSAERAVFIKAPRNLPYGNVARVVDAAKIAGAFPISLQIDRLD